MNVIVPRRERVSQASGRIEAESETEKNRSIPVKFKTGVLLACCLMFGLNHATAQTNVYVDPSYTWQGFMNVFELPQNGGAYDFGSSWGTADLDASFSQAVLTFMPNTSIDRDAPTDPYWWAPDGSPNKQMDANFYVQSDALAGQTVTFSGYCWTNTLVGPYNTNVTAFIKDFSPSFALNAIVTSNLTGGLFSISLATAAGDHIQFGFEMIGPDARITNEAVDGSVVISSNPPPAGPVITGFPGSPYVLLGSNISLTATATGGSLNYQWSKNGVKLMDGPSVSGTTTSSLTLSNVTGGSEADYSLVVSNFSGSGTNQTHLTVVNPSHLAMDPRGNWTGFMNVFNLPGNGGAFQFNSAWAVKDLRATINGALLTMLPNTNVYNPTDPFWVNPDGSGNKSMDAVFFQAFDGLTNSVITVTGFCQTNSLDSAYTNTVFIRDFDSGFANLVAASAPTVSGQPFTITLDTTADPPGHHIQWGFETIGPDANPTNAPDLGHVVVSINPPTVTASPAANAVNLNFGSESGLFYGVQYKTNLLDPAWQTLTTVPGNATNIIVPDSTAAPSRFYRISAQ
jgi:hypothetical protein